jgi:hypothetical protein
LQANYISKTFTEKLKSQGCGFQKCCHTVCSPIKGGICETSQGILSFNLKYLNFSTNKYENINIQARVLELELCDLIIGLPTIKKYNLVTNFAHLYTETEIADALVVARQRGSTSDHSQVVPKEVLYTLATNLRRSARIPMEELLTPEASYEDEFDEQVFEEAPWSSDALHDCTQELELIQLDGSEELKAKLRTLILRYREVFSMTLREKPAEVPPMSLDVDIEKWQVPANQ